MANHEIKHCPRCKGSFECKVGSILLCQCQGLDFSEQEREYIRQTYSDCLCRNCLLLIRHEINTAIMNKKMRAILDPLRGKE